jgi:hypothetical protein
MWKILFLIFFLSCNGGKEVNQGSSKSNLSAIEHLKEAKEILRQEEGQLMIMGRGFSEGEKVRYETLIDTGKKLSTMIDLLEKTQI